MDAKSVSDIEINFITELKRKKKKNFLQLISLNVLGILLFLVVWELLPRLVPNVNILMFPPPSIVVDALGPLLISGELVSNILISLQRALAGFLLAALFGISAGVLTARINFIQHVTDPVLQGFRSIPVIALVPLSVIWFGIGEGSKIALITWGAFFPVWIATFIGVRDVNSIYLRSTEKP